ncbi:MAG: NADH-quinone oxidoreductase subunit NuoK [Planctomycetota bacterium]
MTPLVASLLTSPIGVGHYLVVGAFLFTAGAVCMATKRNLLGVLMGVELVLTGANINFVAIGSPYLSENAVDLGLDGQLMALFVIVLAAAEAAVALAIALNFYNTIGSVDVDQASQLRG